MDRYNNYHKHDHISNIWLPDSNSKIVDYAERAIELDEKNVWTTNHGSGGDIFEARSVCDSKKLNCKFGIEGYIVKNPLEKDNRNYHIVLIPKTNIARKKLNKVNSHANIDGFYYRPRMFLSDILEMFDKNELYITTACVAGIIRDDDGLSDIFYPLYEKFGKNVFVEVQNHDEDNQKNINRRAVKLSKELGISLIAANDSHYIYPHQQGERLELLRGKGIEFGNEETFILDYPDIDTFYNRFVKQGVLTNEEVVSAINQTLVLDECENIDIDKQIKMPTIYPDKTEDEKVEILKKIVNKRFTGVMREDGIDKKEQKKYIAECQREMKVIEETEEVHTADYFLLNEKLFDLAINKYGGILTRTGRGSCGSFILNKILGLTQIDRLQTTLPLYSERFMSTARLLENHALPDFDANVVSQEPFVKASRELLGENGCYPMIAYGTMKESEAFRNVCRSAKDNYDEFNEVGKNIDKYRDNLKWKPRIDEAQKYIGTIISASVHPCAHLLMNDDIQYEVGVLKIGDAICAMITSGEADEWKFLKNDYLIVSVWDIIDKVFKKIGKPIMTVKQLLASIDDSVWKLFDDGITCTLNQVGEDWATAIIRKYKPRSMEELAMFVAAIRPNFAPQRDDFIARKPYTTGSKDLDEVLRATNHRVLFQENLMQYFEWLGITPAESIGLIKKISKKKIKPEDFKNLEERIKKKWIENTGSDKGFDKTWSDMQAQMGYGFNCVSFDTKFLRSHNGKFAPTVEEMYLIKNDPKYAKQTGHYSLHKKYVSFGYGYAFSLFEDGKIHENKIVDIHPAGIRPTFKVTTSSSSSIVCTDNHKFPTPNGEKPLKELSVGDELYHIGEYKKDTSYDYTLTDGNFEKNFPSVGECGFRKNPNGVSVIYDDFRRKCIEERKPCEKCGKLYSGGGRFEVHHKDFDRKNNSVENFSWLCCSCHKKEHYANGRKKKYESGIEAITEKIISIEPAELIQVYDVEMADPSHNFVVDSGIVTSNSPHGESTALDCLYCAYLKSHYPLEYYSVVLNIYKDDVEKTSKLIDELKYFNIKLEAGVFRHSDMDYSFDRETRTIYKGLASLKYISEDCCVELSNMRMLQFDTFTDLLVYIKENTTINIRQLRVLTAINYFREFGKNKKLLDILELFNNRYSKQHTDKTKAKRIAEIKEFEADAEDVALPLNEQIELEQEYVGYITVRIEDIPKRYVYVKDIDTKYTPRATLYCLNTGKTLEMKIDKRTFAKKKIKKGDVIYCKKFIKRENWSKTDDGFVRNGTFSDCLIDWKNIDGIFGE